MNVTFQKIVAAICTALLCAMIFTGLATTTASAHALAPSNQTGNHCLGAEVFPLNGLCVQVNYTVLNSQYAQISSVVECVDVMGPASTATMHTHLDIYSAGSNVRSWDSYLIYGPIGFDSQQCTWFWPWAVVTRYKVGVWVAAYGAVYGDPRSNPEIVPVTWVDQSNFG